jgi:predicted DNA-binding ribbon-helix-helix protein
LITVSELSKEEISKLNLASLLEAKVREINNKKILFSLIIYHFFLQKKSIVLLQTVFSKVKAELLKVNKNKKLNPKEATKKEIIYLINFILWFIKRTFNDYTTINTDPLDPYLLNMKNNLLPKENERILLINTGKSTSFSGYDFRTIILLRLFWTQLKNLIYNITNIVINSLINNMNRGRIITYILNKNRIYCLSYLNLKYNNKKDFKVFYYFFKNILNENNYTDSTDLMKFRQFNKNLYSLIYNLNFLKIAFLNIVLRRNKRKLPEYLILKNTIENKLTYNLVPILYLQSIKKQIKNKKFVFSGKRISKVNINNKNETIWNIPLKDKLIKEAISLYIETQLGNRSIFTTNCASTSTSILFPKKGNNFNTRNKALFYIKNEFQNNIWIIKGDCNCDLFTIFKNSYIIRDIFEKTKIDEYFLDLLSSYLETEYSKKAIKIKEFRINNLLLNIILKELDNLIFKLKNKLEDRKMERELKNHNNQNVSLSYLRYGGKFILGIKGTEKQAESLRKSILGFLNIKNKEEIKMITQWSFYSKEILFLDTILKLERGKNKNIINLIAPLKLICRKLKSRQFIKGLNTPGISFTSCPKYSWLSKNHDQIINLYNNLIIKICNNYLLVDNYNFLVKTLIYYLKGSCAKLLATKFNLKTQSKVYRKFGYDLKSPSGLKFIRFSKNKI